MRIIRGVKMKEKMKKTTALMVLFSGSFLISSCAISPPKVKTPSQKYLDYIKKKYERKAEESKGSDLIKVSVMDTPLKVVISGICAKYGYSCDLTNLPSDVRISVVNYQGDIDSFLSVVRQQTGIKLGFYNGILTVLDKSGTYKKYCSKDEKIKLALKNAKLIDVLRLFAKNYGYSFTLLDDQNGGSVSISTSTTTTATSTTGTTSSGVKSSRGGALIPVGMGSGLPTATGTGGGGEEGIGNMNVSVFYEGCDPQEAFDMIMKNLDLYVKKIGPKTYIIQKYKKLILDKSIFFDYAVGGGVDTGGDGGGGSSGGGGNGGVIGEEYVSGIEEKLGQFLSDEGKVAFDRRGFIVVYDRPSRISLIEDYINKLKAKERTIELKVAILRLDLKKNFQSGIDWSYIFKKSKGTLRNFSISTSTASQVNGGWKLSGLLKGKDFSLTPLITLMEEFGKVNIVQEFDTTARAGLPVVFSMTSTVPYVTVTVENTNNGNTQAYPEIQEKDVGLKITLFPNINEKGEIDLSTLVEVSQYLGDKVFDAGSAGKQFVPLTSSSKVMIPSRVKSGQTVLLTGFKINKAGFNSSGLPYLSEKVKWLFGYNEDNSSKSELMILITPILKY